MALPPASPSLALPSPGVPAELPDVPLELGLQSESESSSKAGYVLPLNRNAESSASSSCAACLALAAFCRFDGGGMKVGAYAQWGRAVPAGGQKH